jgi:hypothetical protein
MIESKRPISFPELGGLAPLRETSATQGKEEFFTRRREGAKKPTRWFEVEDFAKHILLSDTFRAMQSRDLRGAQPDRACIALALCLFAI